MADAHATQQKIGEHIVKEYYKRLSTQPDSLLQCVVVRAWVVVCLVCD